MHCHHEKTIVIDDRVAFVGGIDLTLDGGDPYDSQEHPARGGVGWHDVAVRIEGPAVADVAEHFRLRWHGAADEELPTPKVPEAAGDVDLQIVRTIPENVYERSLPRGDFSVLESYVGAIRSAERLIYIENQFLWSSEIVELIAEKLRDPPHDDFRVVLLLPVSANDGADVSRGQVAALIQADDDNARFLACSVYARTGKLRDPIYVHSKVAIVDDRWLTDRLGEPQRALALQRLRGQRRRPRRGPRTRHAPTPLVGASRASRSTRSTAIRRRSSTSAGSRSPRSSSSVWRTTNPLTHRLVKLPGVSIRHRRFLGPLQGRIYDA